MTTQAQGIPSLPPPAAPQVPAPPALPTTSGQLETQQLDADRTLRSLQAEARDIGRQLRAAVDHRHGLEVRLSHASGGQIAAFSQQLAGVDASIAQLEANLASVSTRIAQIQVTSRPGQIGFPPFRGSGPGMNGDNIAIVSVIFMLAVLMPLSVALARRLLRRTPHEERPASDPMANARLERLEQAMDAIAIEIERISEGQRFVTKVLTERPVPASTPSSVQGDVSSHGEARRALGAGPMETIRAPERQGVRQSITPH